MPARAAHGRAGTVDRILLGACAAVWLALVGAERGCRVALVDLGRGFHEARRGARTRRGCCTPIIIVSAVIILAAIPVLLRARRITRDGPVARSAGMPARGAGRQPSKSGTPPRDRIPAGSYRADDQLRPALSDAAVDRFWLRGTVR